MRDDQPGTTRLGEGRLGEWTPDWESTVERKDISPTKERDEILEIWDMG